MMLVPTSDNFFSFAGLHDQNVPRQATNSNSLLSLDDFPIYVSP